MNRAPRCPNEPHCLQRRRKRDRAPALRRGLRPRLRLGGTCTTTFNTQIQINNGHHVNNQRPPMQIEIPDLLSAGRTDLDVIADRACERNGVLS